MHPPDLSDYELIHAAKKDSLAFGQLYDRYIHRIYAYTASRIMHREEAEDITSDIWFKALKALPSFYPKREESIIAWLFTIARNCVQDAYRRQRPLESIDTEEVEMIASNEENPAHLLDRQHIFSLLSAALDTLPSQQAHCLRLRYYGGLKNIEISLIERLHEKTVAAHVSRGLQALRLQFPSDDHPIFEFISLSSL
jgi:RNA polymerase sigma-70 factor (ECF subfamily)